MEWIISLVRVSRTSLTLLQRWFPSADWHIAGIPWCGPSRQASNIGRHPPSAMQFMRRYNIPTSEFRIFNEYEIAKAFLDRTPESFKEEEVDGQVDTPLGPMTNVKRSPKHAIIMTTMREDSDRWVPCVAIPLTKQQAHANARWVLNPEPDCPDQQCLMVEKRLDGIQITITTFSDGKYINSLPPVEVTEGKTDFGASKPFDGDKACIAPVQNLSPELLKEIEDAILRPTLGALIKNNEHYFLKVSGHLAGEI